MKILYVTSVPLEYNSSANMRNMALIQGLTELGHEVYSLSPEADHESTYFDKSIKTSILKKRYWMVVPRYSNNQLKNKKTFLYKVKERIRLIAYKLYITFSIYDTRARISNKIPNEINDEKFDLIISSSDPKSAHLIVENLRKRNPNITKQWIQYWGDPFAMDINRTSKAPIKLIEKEEFRILNEAGLIVYVSPLTYSFMKSKYKDLSSKMIFEPVPYINKKIYSEPFNNSFTIGYFGDYFKKDRNLLPLVKSSEANDILLYLVGNNDLKIETQSNIQVLPRQNSNFISKMEEKMDLLVCVCNRKGTQIPGKIYHYSATNKPILLIVDGENKNELIDYFSTFNRFYICENSETSIRDTLNKIKRDNKKFEPLDFFSAKTIAHRILTQSLREN